MNNILVEELEFPLILLGPETEHTVEVVKSLEQLTTTTQLGLKRKSLLNCTLIDTAGGVFQIQSIAKKGNKNPFWKFEFFNPMIEIAVELKEVDRNLDLSTIKEIVKSAINQNAHLWGENFELRSVKQRVDNSGSLEAIINTLTTIN